MFFPHMPGFSPCTQAFSQSNSMHDKCSGLSKLLLDMSVCTCLFVRCLCCPVMDWQPVYNGLHLYSLLSSPRTPKHFTLQSVIHTFILTVVDYFVATATLGQTNQSGAALQAAPPCPLATISRQEVSYRMNP
ncbi:hypothetical protein AMECASPLE_038582 [Ameca splendens]|uniref:Uncharacterized protein n=1 Tax=Ameca splendens TaxID=208324 RepID=A0ABV0XX46_9TELE